MPEFHVVSEYSPAGDQPKAIEALANGVEMGFEEQTLLGVTGSGKTYTMAKVIEKLQRPTLILAHNKTLAAQLCSEFKEFFPNNAVEYYVSHYDHYKPEAYVPHIDFYVEKDVKTNDELERLRHSATSAVVERRDVVIVASVSCIFALGDPVEYNNMMISLRPGQKIDREQLLRKLVEIHYERNDVAFDRNLFRVRGDTVEVFPAYNRETAIRIEMFGNEIERLSEIHIVTGSALRALGHVSIYPATHYISGGDAVARAVPLIEREMWERVQYFKDNDKLIEAQRIQERTLNDVELMLQLGSCSGIENYSRVLGGREPGSKPYTLLDFFPKDFIMFIDESHVSIPQLRGMYLGDRARKQTLIDYGFRLPSALDNRPLSFEEFQAEVPQLIYVSATPGEYERSRSAQVVEQIIRPTGLLDPCVEVRPIQGQVDDLVGEINERAARGERILVTTLTKKMAEDLTEYLKTLLIRVRYMHHEVDPVERMELIRDLRLGEYDVLIGINLLREGLDLPEVSMVAVLDADKEGLLRNETSLIQTIGRAARNANGRVVLYADKMTRSMRLAIDETERRRKRQQADNEAKGIVPKTIVKNVRKLLEISRPAETKDVKTDNALTREEKLVLIAQLEKDMKKAAKLMEFEYAAVLRDRIIKLSGR